MTMSEREKRRKSARARERESAESGEEERTRMYGAVSEATTNKTAREPIAKRSLSLQPSPASPRVPKLTLFLTFFAKFLGTSRRLPPAARSLNPVMKGMYHKKAKAIVLKVPRKYQRTAWRAKRRKRTRWRVKPWVFKTFSKSSCILTASLALSDWKYPLIASLPSLFPFAIIPLIFEAGWTLDGLRERSW